MRRLVSFWALFSALTVFGQGKHALLLPDFIPTLVTDVVPSELLFTDSNIAIVEVEDAKLEQWIIRVHNELGACGGFIDVTEDLKAGATPAQLVWDELRRREQVTDADVTFEISGRKEIAELVAKANADSLWAFLGELTAFPDRSATTENGKAAAKFLQDRADKLAKNRAGYKSKAIETKSAFYNKQPSIVASLEGTDPSLPHVVIGGHMDTFSPDRPGADDDGSGSAIVMEAFRTVVESGAKFKRTIDFMWYSAEERGLVGSSNVVKYYTAEKVPVYAAMQFDMVGYHDPADTEDVYLVTDYTHGGLNDAMKKLITTYVTSKVGTTKCGYACSDHASWTRANIPAVIPFEATMAHYNKTLHTKNDTMALLSKEYSFRFAKIAVAYLGELAELQK